MRRIGVKKERSIPITEAMVQKAYKKVKSNKGSSGVDQVSLASFQQDLSNNLYKIWNRLSSGSYFPIAVREVTIPKSNGGNRKLGIPSIGDRVAQQVIKDYLEPRLESQFHDSSYGYRPLRSAHQAVTAVRKNVIDYAWVIDIDIKNFFDEVDHVLLMKALDRHVEERWVKMYIQRWLEAPVMGSDGQTYMREGKGTPQGGVISPLLANLYLHYTLDKWMAYHHVGVPFVRYADDVIVHCQEETEAHLILDSIRERLSNCGLSLNEEKTKIVYCRNYRRSKRNFGVKFDFLGFRFQPRSAKASGDTGFYLWYDCRISPSSIKRIVQGWRSEKLHKRTHLDLPALAAHINKSLEGVLKYYCKISRRGMGRLIEALNFRLVKWVQNKYGRFGGSYTQAYRWLKGIRDSYPNLFSHWKYRYLYV